MSQNAFREKIREDLFFLSFCDRKYIRGFKVIWAEKPGRDYSVDEILDLIPEEQLRHLRRQIDNALAKISKSS